MENERKKLKARSCYGHLGGTLGDLLFQQMLAMGWFAPDGEKSTVYVLTPEGEDALAGMGVDIYEKSRKRK